MISGQKVVCIDDVTTEDVRGLYSNWITKGTTYVIRDVVLGQNIHGEWGEIGLLLVGIENPPQSIPPYQERSFNSDRFRPIEDRALLRSKREEVSA